MDLTARNIPYHVGFTEWRQKVCHRKQNNGRAAHFSIFCVKALSHHSVQFTAFTHTKRSGVVKAFPALKVGDKSHARTSKFRECQNLRQTDSQTQQK